MESMETIIVEVRMGVSGVVRDFALPAHVRIGVLMADLAELIEQSFPELQMDKENPMLLDAERECPLQRSLTLAQAGIRDGARLIFV